METDEIFTPERLRKIYLAGSTLFGGLLGAHEGYKRLDTKPEIAGTSLLGALVGYGAGRYILDNGLFKIPTGRIIKEASVKLLLKNIKK